jgi:hypothetical protein
MGAPREAERKRIAQTPSYRLATKENFKVCFYDPVRRGQDLEREQESRKSLLAEPGFLVIPNVTLQYVQRAVATLSRSAYFKHLVPRS